MSVELVEDVYRALTPHNKEPSIAPPKLAIIRQSQWASASPDARSAVEASAARLRQNGLVAEEVSINADFVDLPRSGKIIHDYEMCRSLLEEWLGAPHLMAPSLVQKLDEAASVTTAAYREALQHAIRQRQIFDDFGRSYDAVISPAALGEAPIGLSSTGDPAMNIAWSTLHSSCITLPVMYGASQMPIGLQLSAPRFTDLNLLRVAKQIDAILRTTAAKI